MENVKISGFFFSRDMSPNMPSLCMTFEILFFHIVMEGTVSRNFDLGPNIILWNLGNNQSKKHKT